MIFFENPELILLLRYKVLRSQVIIGTFTFIFHYLLDAASLRITEALVLSQGPQLLLLLLQNMLVLQVAIDYRPIRLNVLFILKTDYLVFKWIKLAVVLFLLGDRLQADEFVIGAGAAATEDCDEEEEGYSGSYEHKVLEGKQEEDEAQVVHLLGRVDEGQRVLLLVFDQGLFLELVTKADKLRGGPHEYWNDEEVFDERDQGDASVAAAKLYTAFGFVWPPILANDPVDRLPAAAQLVVPGNREPNIDKQVGMHGMHKHEEDVEECDGQQHDRGQRHLLRYLIVQGHHDADLVNCCHSYCDEEE